jgi:PAS domain S-box-containing protein
MLYLISVLFISTTLAIGLIAMNILLRKNVLQKKLDQIEMGNANYQNIIEQTNDVLLVVDIVEGKVHLSNPSACAMLGYSKAVLETKVLGDLQPPEMMQRSSGLVADVWEKKGLIFSDIPFVSATGEYIPVECSAKVAEYAGRPAIIIYARDIRERLKLESELQIQQELIKVKNKNITDSINYARRIQTAVLPGEEDMAKHLSDYFVLYKPKDIVSGDFYWFSSVVTTKPKQSKQISLLLIAAVDCTGHGVPGAFMSLVGSTLLNQTITNPNINHPSDALNYLNRELKRTLRRQVDESSVRDGMDMTLCAIDLENMLLEFAGANNPVYIIRKQELIELKGDKQPIGSDSDETISPFTNQIIPIQAGDSIYLFTDGYADQFGGPKGKKFKNNQFKEVLLGMKERPMKEQCVFLDNKIEEWKAYRNEEDKMYEQVDDILIIGIRI